MVGKAHNSNPSKSETPSVYTADTHEARAFKQYVRKAQSMIGENKESALVLAMFDWSRRFSAITNDNGSPIFVFGTEKGTDPECPWTEFTTVKFDRRNDCQVDSVRKTLRDFDEVGENYPCRFKPVPEEQEFKVWTETPDSCQLRAIDLDQVHIGPVDALETHIGLRNGKVSLSQCVPHEDSKGADKLPNAEGSDTPFYTVKKPTLGMVPADSIRIVRCNEKREVPNCKTM